MRQLEGWKTDRELHNLIIQLQRKANEDLEVTKLCKESHKTNQIARLCSDKYCECFSIRLRELYKENGIDTLSLDASIQSTKDKICRRERYIKNECSGEY